MNADKLAELDPWRVLPWVLAGIVAWRFARLLQAAPGAVNTGLDRIIAAAVDPFVNKGEPLQLTDNAAARIAALRRRFGEDWQQQAADPATAQTMRTYLQSLGL